MSDAKYDKILNYLEKLSIDVAKLSMDMNEFKKETLERFEAVEYDLTSLKETANRTEAKVDALEARQAVQTT